MKNNLQAQYNGFLKTAPLWDNSKVFGLHQFEFDTSNFQIENDTIFKEIRLGKRVEEFLSFQFNKLKNIEVLAENIQIQNEKITIGEFDFLLKNDAQVIHLEVVYKFYLYDPNIKTDNYLNNWIGPNRKDALVYKLNKLKEKQLPLLYSEHSKNRLKTLNINTDEVKQYVCYKAQLFLPFNQTEIDITPISSNCVSGFYLSFSEFEKLKDFKFYIPKKLDWLVIPHINVKWESYEDAKSLISNFITEERSPMVWLLSDKGEIFKCFITFW